MRSRGLLIIALAISGVLIASFSNARWAMPTLQLVAAATIEERAKPDDSARFTVIDVFIDSRAEPLAAYEFELTTQSGDVQIVGIERGDDPNFSDPPYYDPAAMSQNRVIVGAFNTTANLPLGKTRVARLHVRVGPGERATYATKLIVAGSREGKAIGASVMVVEGASK
jgi:hypothetical protein